MFLPGFDIRKSIGVMVHLLKVSVSEADPAGPCCALLTLSR